MKAPTTSLFFNMFAATSLAFIYPAQGSEQRNDATRECVDLFEQKTSAFLADDWDATETISNKLIQQCKGSLSKKMIGNAYNAASTSALELMRPLDALNYAKSCIEFYYPASDCHLRKISSLLKLNRLDESKKATLIAEKLIENNLSLARKKLDESSSSIDEQLYTSEIEGLQAQARLLGALNELVDENIKINEDR